MLYLKVAEQLRKNPGQWSAYESGGHCIVLAGPGSGKTKTLTVKLARLLAEDVQEPRGVACITYNNECARELEKRLGDLGIEPGQRVFVGTVHSFSLTQIVLPYTKSARLDLPEDFSIATQTDRKEALERALRRTIGKTTRLQDWEFRMGNYRRSILNRDSKDWRTQDPTLACLVEAFEEELRAMRRIDFDDMPLLAVRALRKNEWLRRALYSKYPILVIDEYQDLGRALHRMVMGLCFSAGMRLFAVGDIDQSIYGFVGARAELLQQLSERDDVETVRLRLNYRSGARIVTASSYALGEERDYEAAEGTEEGTIYFHPQTGEYSQQASHMFSTLLPEIRARMYGLRLGDIAILYPAAWIGDAVAGAAQDCGVMTIRNDKKSLYPRSSRLMRWLEQCAEWCCRGWRTSSPRFTRIVSEGRRLFAETLQTDEDCFGFQVQIMTVLWNRRDSSIPLSRWLYDLQSMLLDDRIAGCRTLHDEGEILKEFMERTTYGGDCADMVLGELADQGEGSDCVNLSTLHSSKGREFSVVIMFGIDRGRIPRHNSRPQQMLEARRLFYVGFTRAKTELHIMYSVNRASPFVNEVQKRLDAETLGLVQ